jgi:hypothetical protein
MKQVASLVLVVAVAQNTNSNEGAIAAIKRGAELLCRGTCILGVTSLAKPSPKNIVLK